MYFSKSKYTEFWKCPKKCWLDEFKPEVKESDGEARARMVAGRETGELAKGLFGDFIDVTEYKTDGALDLAAMTEKTKRLVADGTENICEAAFSFNGLYCAVDILRKENGGYAIYEVKSTSKIKDYHYADVAYQKYVLERCGVTVTGAHIVILNNKYVRNGAPDIKKLFSVDGGRDISKAIADEYGVVESNLKKAEAVMSCSAEPKIDIGKQCKDCEYWKYCSRGLPKLNVFDIYAFGKKWDCYEKGVVSFDDVLRSGVKLSEIQSRQIEYALCDKGTYINKSIIAEFLGKLSYPLYFLDFETMSGGVPEYDGVCPFEQIPFQYSVHFIARADGEAEHREFLAEPCVDPRRPLAERLCADIPKNVCTVAYHAETERGIVNKLAELFPDLSAHLRSIASNIVDLLPVFKSGGYYKREMGGSFSIKSVLPAVCPEMDYHNLDGVQNGTDAMSVFPTLKDMPPDEAQKVREELLKYCERDTLAMVKLLQELVRDSNLS